MRCELPRQKRPLSAQGPNVRLLLWGGVYAGCDRSRGVVAILYRVAHLHLGTIDELFNNRFVNVESFGASETPNGSATEEGEHPIESSTGQDLNIRIFAVGTEMRII